MMACQWGWSDVVDRLIQLKCNIHTAMQDGTTALFLAAQGGHSDIIRSLIYACEARGREVGIFVVAPRRDGAAPLFIAAQMGHAECVRILLENQAEVDQCRLVSRTDGTLYCDLRKTIHLGNY